MTMYKLNNLSIFLYMVRKQSVQLNSTLSTECGRCYKFFHTKTSEPPPIYHGEFVKDRKSIFQGHLAPVTDTKEVDIVIAKLKENTKIASATHNIIAYRIDCKNGNFTTGDFDDGETYAASRVLRLLEIVDARNVLVVVTRWYGGIHLGSDRFKHITNCAKDLLNKYGYIHDKMNNTKDEAAKSKNKH